jgi:hypothetical protein
VRRSLIIKKSQSHEPQVVKTHAPTALSVSTRPNPRTMRRAYFRELRRIVAASEPSECIALANVHLLELG